ncbi:hypothetical protein M419DRAFT_138720 [Trichoderma reesei RUT C-30]|uniref:Uncharacterized protein n=1 Tax=Hypocrea jecorina (strain ATCC 56765 / BCRC 32924 / NRRL 11460 / Rut C-30) TaxID=1344414 RepID=A0A024S0Z8_HYPJR|nr:hypothetical protein M419DRAFT_138720 [Trichoderma reesei RUT C-30]
MITMTHWLFAGLFFCFSLPFLFFLSSSIFLFLCLRVGREEMHIPLVFQSSKGATRVPVLELSHDRSCVLFFAFSSFHEMTKRGERGTCPRCIF